MWVAILSQLKKKTYRPICVSRPPLELFKVVILDRLISMFHFKKFLKYRTLEFWQHLYNSCVGHFSKKNATHWRFPKAFLLLFRLKKFLMNLPDLFLKIPPIPWFPFLRWVATLNEGNLLNFLLVDITLRFLEEGLIQVVVYSRKHMVDIFNLF